jgi:acyl dehydratase
MWTVYVARACWVLEAATQETCTDMKIIEIAKLPHSLLINVNAMRSSLKKPGVVEALPPVMFVRPKVVVSGSKVAKYAKVCGFNKAQGVPMLFPHLEAFPLAMMLFGSKYFPWPAMGLVHLANRAKQYKRINVGDELRIEVQTGELYAHKKGQVLTLHARALRQGDLVWDSTWTLLSMAVRLPKGPDYTSALADESPLSHQADFMAASGIGRRYASVSGDVNPIHMTDITAKLMGFRKAIAHGMWTKARALSMLMPKDAVDQAEVNVEFKTPLFIPSRTSLWAHRTEHRALFEVRNAKGEKAHLRGLVTY